MTSSERLASIESELARITERQHRDAVRKAQLVDEATRLRCSLTQEQAVQYQALKAIEMATGRSHR